MITTITSDLKQTNVKHEMAAQRILIHTFSVQSNEYIVSYLNSNDREQNLDVSKSHMDLISTLKKDTVFTMSTQTTPYSVLEYHLVQPHQIEVATCAKYYPLVDTLIQRGNKAAASAQTMIHQKQPKVLKFVQNVRSKDILDGDETAQLKNNLTTKLNQVTNEMKGKVSQSIPTQETRDALYKMLRDEELTSLLSKSKERLEYLMTGGGLTDSMRTHLRDIGLEIDTNSNISSTVAQARERAVMALNQLLTDHMNVSLDEIQTTIGQTFGDMFDSLSVVAKSDQVLHSILGDISNKTSQWQNESGRLLSTRSSFLFLEGSQRLHARLGALLSPKQIEMVDKAGADLTKAFTEGDVALARLKSIELGESVRNRLFHAIEVRSETQGGLDSIIAGAITQVGGDSVGNMLREMHDLASSSTVDANESLIALLSDRSQYHDLAIQRIEQLFVDLESRLGFQISPTDIASLANGDGGTAMIFEPIAAKASKEIQNQLDLAEATVEDPNILGVISHVRKIMKGELTLTNLVDDVVTLLDSDSAVGTGTFIAQKGEEIFDVLENVSENAALGGIIGAVEKAGLNKDSILHHLEKLDMNSVLDAAGSVVTDENKRLELLSSATDIALDFLLKILPSMPIPPFEGVKDGLIYNIENLSMHGFKLKKEDIMVEIAGIRATQDKQNIHRRDVNANQILIIDVQNISAVFEDAEWSFEQTYLPYLKGSGKATVNLSKGHIKKGFELKKLKSSDGNKGWKPVLCLNDRSVSIDEISITFETSNRLQWVINKLAVIFKGPLRNYVVQVIDNILATKSGWLLEHLNNTLAPHWDIILRTSRLSIDSLQEVSKSDIMTFIDDPTANEVDLVWKEFLPLGINLVLNDKSGLIKVVDFPRGSQARKVCIDRQLDPDSFKDSTVVAINGYRFERKDEAQNRLDMMLALRDQSRPKTIKFKLVPQSKDIKNNSILVSNSTKGTDEEEYNLESGTVNVITVLQEGPLGLTFERALDDRSLVVQSIDIKGSFKAAMTIASPTIIEEGDLLTHVNNTCLVSSADAIEKAYHALESQGLTRPLRLSFIKPHLRRVSFQKKDSMIGGPHEFVWEHKPENDASSISGVHLKNFNMVDGAVEARGVFLGDHLIFLNGQPVGTGHELRPDFPFIDLRQVADMLTDESSYPICLTFARPQSDTRMGTFDVEMLDKTVSVVADKKDKLGFTIGIGHQSNHFVVKGFKAVVGSFQDTMIDEFGSDKCRGLRIYSIDGELIPSYANCDLVTNALKRAWLRSNEMELTFCDDKLFRKYMLLQADSM